MLRFVTSHSGRMLGLSLVNEEDMVLLSMTMMPWQGRTLISALSGGSVQPLQCNQTSMAVVPHDEGFLILIDTGGPYLSFKVILTRGQAADLASTIGMHLHAIETASERDFGPPLDDKLGGWSPDNERQKYGGAEPDDNDPADDWKRKK